MLLRPLFHGITIEKLYDLDVDKLELLSREGIEKQVNQQLTSYKRTGMPNYFWLVKDLMLHGMPMPLHDEPLGIGIEVECENVPDILIPSWSSKKDDSLRNDGKEYITEPIEHPAVPLSLALLYSTLYSGHLGGKWSPDFSWRTSIHIHLNVRNWTLEEIFKLLLIYTIYEKVLFRYAANNRENSNFCVPLRQSTLVKALADFANGHYNIGGLQQVWEKYSALNLSRLNNYGTVEFRQMPGTGNYQKVNTWVGLIVSMAVAAKTTAYDDLITIIKSINTTSQFDLLTRSIFKFPYDKALFAESTKDFEEGVSVCKRYLSSEFSKTVNVYSQSAMGRFLNKKEEKLVVKVNKVNSAKKILPNNFLVLDDLGVDEAG